MIAAALYTRGKEKEANCIFISEIQVNEK